MRKVKSTISLVTRNTRDARTACSITDTAHRHLLGPRLMRVPFGKSPSPSRVAGILAIKFDKDQNATETQKVWRWCGGGLAS